MFFKAFGLWFSCRFKGFLFFLECVRGGVLEVSPVLVEFFEDFRSEGRAGKEFFPMAAEFGGSGAGTGGALLALLSIYMVDRGAPVCGFCGLVCI